jgi:hypothetical protein
MGSKGWAFRSVLSVQHQTPNTKHYGLLMLNFEKCLNSLHLSGEGLGMGAKKKPRKFRSFFIIFQKEN